MLCALRLLIYLAYQKVRCRTQAQRDAAKGAIRQAASFKKAAEAAEEQAARVQDEMRLQNGMLIQELQALRQSTQARADDVRAVSRICCCMHKIGNSVIL